MRFKEGFYYKNKTYGWKDDELYRMPHIAKGRNYTLQKLKLQKNSRGKPCYLIDNKPKSMRQLEAMTVKIDFIVKKISSKDTPF